MKKIVSALTVLLVVISAAFAETYTWVAGGGWANFANPQNWKVNGETAATCPGSSDWLKNINTQVAFTFTEDHSVAGIEKETSSYSSRSMFISGAALTFLEGVNTRFHSFDVYQNGKLVFGPDCTTDFEWGGAHNYLRTLAANTEIDLYGTVIVGSGLTFTNCANAKMVIAPTSWTFIAGANTSGSTDFANLGEMDFPQAITFDHKNGVSMTVPTVVRQLSGIMTMGGSLTLSAYAKEKGDTLAFELQGGTLAITGAVSFADFASFSMPIAESSVAITIAEDCKFALPEDVTCADGVALTVSGEGTFVLGSSLPDAALSFDGLAKAAFTGETDLNGVADADQTTFVIDDELTQVASFRIVIDDDTLRAKILNDLQEQAATWSVVEDGTSLIVKELASAGEDMRFYWQGSGWKDFSNPSYWKVGASASEAVAAMRAPGEFNWLGLPSSAQFFGIMNGLSKVQGYKGTYSDYNARELNVAYGRLEFVGFMETRQHALNVWTDGEMAFMPTATVRVEWGGGKNTFKTCDPSAKLEIFGTVMVGSQLTVTNMNNATMTIAPQSWGFHIGAQYGGGQCFANSGYMNFPSGLTFCRDGYSSYGSAAIAVSFVQRAGTMTLGGTIARDAGTRDTLSLSFDLVGGTLAVTNDIDMLDFGETGLLTSGSAATVAVAEDCVFDWTNAVFATGTTLTVDGAGTLKLGEFPPALVLNAGSTLCFGKKNTDLTDKTLTGLADATVKIDATLKKHGTVVATGSASLLADLATKINAAMDPSWGRVVEVQDSNLVVVCTNGLLVIIE